MNKLLRLGGLEKALECFVQNSCSALVKDFETSDLTPKPFKLIINDQQITDKKQLNDSNGRYFFRRPGVWEMDYIPNADSPGVYLFFNESEIAIYAGKSESTIGSRVATHVGNYDNTGFPNLAFPSATYIVTIPFKCAPFLAPAFESYLLAKYTFEHNSVGQKFR